MQGRDTKWVNWAAVGVVVTCVSALIAASYVVGRDNGRAELEIVRETAVELDRLVAEIIDQQISNSRFGVAEYRAARLAIIGLIEDSARLADLEVAHQEVRDEAQMLRERINGLERQIEQIPSHQALTEEISRLEMLLRERESELNRQPDSANVARNLNNSIRRNQQLESENQNLLSLLSEAENREQVGNRVIQDLESRLRMIRRPVDVIEISSNSVFSDHARGIEVGYLGRNSSNQYLLRISGRTYYLHISDSIIVNECTITIIRGGFTSVGVRLDCL